MGEQYSLNIGWVGECGAIARALPGHCMPLVGLFASALHALTPRSSCFCFHLIPLMATTKGFFWPPSLLYETLAHKTAT